MNKRLTASPGHGSDRVYAWVRPCGAWVSRSISGGVRVAKAVCTTPPNAVVPGLDRVVPGLDVERLS